MILIASTAYAVAAAPDATAPDAPAPDAPAPDATAPDATAPDATTVYERADLEQQIEAIGPQIQEAFDAQLDLLSLDNSVDTFVTDRVRHTITQAFSASLARTAMIDALDTGTTRAERTEVLQWLESPVGQHILYAEQAAVHSDIEDFDAFQSMLQSNPLPPARQQVFEELDAALGATRAGARLLQQFDLAIAVAQHAALQTQSDSAMADTQLLLPTVSEYEDAVRDHVRAHHQFAYRDIPTSTLKHYIAFAGSLSGARFLTAVQSGLEDAISKGTWKLVTSIMKLQQSPKQIMTELTL